MVRGEGRGRRERWDRGIDVEVDIRVGNGCSDHYLGVCCDNYSAFSLSVMNLATRFGWYPHTDV